MAKYRIPSDYKNDISRALHNWKSPVGGTVHPGLAYPLHHRHLNTGDRVRGRIETLVQSQPMRGPLLNGFKHVTIAVFMPDSYIYGWMRNGKRFTPDQYMGFGKWRFSASGFASTSYDDPVFKDRRIIMPLARGMSPNDSSNGGTFFEQWVSDRDLESGSRYSHVGRGGLWDWLGVAPGAVHPYFGKGISGGLQSESFKWSISPFICYFLSCYYYIANMQEDYMYFTRSVAELSPGTTANTLSEIPFNKLFSSINPNDFLDCITSLASLSASGSVPDLGTALAPSISRNHAFYGMISSALGGHGGLIAVPYSPDLFGNIIKQGTSPSTQIEVINDPDGTASNTGYTVAVPELRLKTKIQNMADRYFVSGGRFGDVLRTLWGTKSSPYINKPEFLGVWQTAINPLNTVATSNGVADDESMNVGQMAARVDDYSKYKGTQGIDYYAKEPGTLMFITMLVPQPSYCQGLHPDLFSPTFADDFNPELAGLGFTSIPRHRFTMMPEGFANRTASNPWFSQDSAPTGSVDPTTVSVGDEVAWSWLRTDYPRLHGEFAQNGVYQYWTLVRRFTEYYIASKPDAESPAYTDFSYYGTYVNPLSWQYLFVGNSFADPNFTILADVNLSVTSSVPANYMPYLGR